ncbi:hypothetical protein [Trichococcus paludicola]|uniref:hypothetical protein n=1 Tax=Trichococcus paludicola TaxID=2052942 RepID=UPI00131CF6DD|nr:hypothetical protein [Trichococcus paludicola]
MDVGCPILPGYRTASYQITGGVSDSFGLSDNRIIVQGLVVRFFRIIGQPHRKLGSGCPILSGYRTTSYQFTDWLSDSSGLSDNFVHECSY